jgi:hypothetical protein
MMIQVWWPNYSEIFLTAKFICSDNGPLKNAQEEATMTVLVI